MNEKKSASRSSSISQRLIVLIVLFSSCITLVASGIQIYRDYDNDIRYIDEQFGQVEQSFIDSVRRSVWLLDEAQIATQLEGILRMRDISHVSITTDGHIAYDAGSEPRNSSPNRQFSLTYYYNGQDVDLGYLNIHASLDGVYSRLLDRIWAILVSNAIKTFAVATFIYFLFENMVTRHVGSVAGFLRQVSLDQLARSIALDRKPPRNGRSDELDDLVDSINEMRRNLLESIAAKALSERRFDARRDYIGIGSWDWDITANVMDWSDGVSSIFGYRDSKLAPSFENYMAATHPDDRYLARQAIDAALRGDKEFEIEHRVVWPDGTVHWVHGRGYVLRDMTGKALKMAGLVLDISARKEAEEKLQEAKEKAESYLDIAEAIIVELDVDGRVKVLNTRGCDILQCDSETVVGRDWFDLVLTQEMRAPMREMFHGLITGEVKPIEYFENEIVTAGDERRFVAWHNVLRYDDDGKVTGTLSSGQDITRRRDAEEALRRSQKMEAIGQLTGGVAHDFNNTMAVMLGSAEMLDDVVRGDPNAEYFLGQLKRSVQRGASLTQRLLAFSRMQTLAPQVADIKALIHDLEDMLRRSLGETIYVTVKAQQDLWSAYVDAAQLEHALINLVVNAKHAMGQSGELTIAMRNARIRKRKTGDLGEVMPGDYVEVSVIDTGTGMAPDILERAFEPFFTTKDVGEGSGLGLSMVYGFAKQSNGHIVIDSTVGAGTQVRLYLPKAMEKKKPAARKGPGDGDIYPVGVERILFLEDDPFVRDAPVQMLKRQGYEVIEASDGAEAIALLKSGEPFDLLFTDVVLPGGINGVAVAEQALRLQPGIRVLYTTGYCDVEVISDAKLENSDAVVNKPYKRAELLTRVRQILDEKAG